MPTQLIKSAGEYDAVTQEGTVVVTFFATWNGPSRQIKPFIEETSNKKEYMNIKFVLVDADECPELTEREDVSSMPTLKIYKNGKCMHNLTGANQAAVDDCLKRAI
ncbi:thioredoxin [Cyclospora cayetanensis]|uniref:Thioredoxin related protein n=2 Tax=Cyclospora cayetanensis TaxID=88456 RepID=A0A1D3D994_9EIME|nr:thioredoxin [Cyclospora cayetanensis]OEH80032.1 thioredoxin related protein [Cyclospora cayetanensis]